MKTCIEWRQEFVRVFLLISIFGFANKQNALGEMRRPPVYHQRSQGLTAYNPYYPQSRVSNRQYYNNITGHPSLHYPRPVVSSCNPRSILPQATAEQIGERRHPHSVGANVFATQSPYKELDYPRRASAMYREVQIPSSRDQITFALGTPNNTVGQFGLNGIRTYFDINQLAPIQRILFAHSDTYRVYGTQDPTTGQQIPTAIELTFVERQFPRQSGITAIDQDRALKFTGAREKHDGDEEEDYFFGSIVFKVTPQGICPVSGVRRGMNSNETIRLTRGQEYHFKLGPNQSARRPFTDELQARISAAADYQVAQVVAGIDHFTCGGTSVERLRMEAASLPVAVPAECRVQGGF